MIKDVKQIRAEIDKRTALYYKKKRKTLKIIGGGIICVCICSLIIASILIDTPTKAENFANNSTKQQTMTPHGEDSFSFSYKEIVNSVVDSQQHTPFFAKITLGENTIEVFTDSTFYDEIVLITEELASPTTQPFGDITNDKINCSDENSLLSSCYSFTCTINGTERTILIQNNGIYHIDNKTYILDETLLDSLKNLFK